MGCNCNCLRKEPESNNEMLYGEMPSIGINNKDNLNEIININTENDNEEEDNNVNEKDKNNNIITENINDNIKDNAKVNDNENNNLNNSLSIKDEEKNEIYDKLKVSNAQTGLSRNTPRRIISNDSSAVSKIQDLYESIFEYFNEIRIKPDKFKKIAESHGVLLIINNFYNLLLSSYLNNYTNDGEDNNKLLEEIEKEEKIKNFNKKLFVIDGDIDNSNEVVWKLIEKNKSIAMETFFSNAIDCLVISCQMINNQNFKCYFLFLSKKI